MDVAFLAQMRQSNKYGSLRNGANLFYVNLTVYLFLYFCVCIWVCIFVCVSLCWCMCCLWLLFWLHLSCLIFYLLFLFCFVFFSTKFMIHRTAREGGGYLFNSSLPFPPASHLDISQAITAESSPLHIASSWTENRNLWFPRTSC